MGEETVSTRRPIIAHPEAEQQVLGVLTVFPDSFGEVAALLEASDFYEPRHQAIFSAVDELRRSGRPVDLITLSDMLSKDGSLERSGGAAYLAELMDVVVTSANVGYYARLVKNKAVARRLYEAFAGIAGQCVKAEAVTDLLTTAYSRLEEETRAHRGGGDAILTMADMAEWYGRHIADLNRNRFTTGYEPLDAVIKGVAPGETMFICAYSGLGKSALLHNLFLSACKRTGMYHLFFSLEMPITRVFERTVQIALGQYTYHVESTFAVHNRDKRAQTMLDLAAAGASKLLVCEEGGLTIERIEHYTRLARARYGNLGAIGIDYLGLMGAEGTRSEYERISYVAEHSKHLAKRLNVPVIVLGQINRSSAAQGEVEKWSAKGSGSIEASADYLLGLAKKDGHLLLKLLKNRNGEEGITFKVNVKWPFLRFEDLEPWDDNAVRNVARSRERTRKSVTVTLEEEDPY